MSFTSVQQKPKSKPGRCPCFPKDVIPRTAHQQEEVSWGRECGAESIFWHPHVEMWPPPAPLPTRERILAAKSKTGVLPRHSLAKGSCLKEKGIWVLPRLCESVSHSFVSNSLQPHGLYSTRLLCPWASPGKNTGVGFHSLLQGIFSTQGLKPGLLHCRRTRYSLSHQGSPMKTDKLYWLSLTLKGVWSCLWLSRSHGRHLTWGGTLNMVSFRVLRKEEKKQLYNHRRQIKQTAKSAQKRVTEQGALNKSHRTLKATEQVWCPHPRYRLCTPAISKRHSKCQRAQWSNGNCEDKRCHSL